MLLEIPELLSADEVRQCRAALAEAIWDDGRKTAGHLAARVKSNLQLPLDHPLGKQIGDLILDRLGANPLFMSAVLPHKVLPPRFNRYEGEGAYGNHVDNALFNIPGTAIRVRTDVSSTLFFSDPDAYEGGELVIEDSYGTHSIKLPAGHLVIYPGTSLHRVTPVTRGTRFASFFWSQSLVRSQAQRRMLFELDTAIQQLTRDGAVPQTLDQLSGVYHNLLREWADA